MTWSNVNFEANTIYLPGTKTESSPRWIPMTENLRQFLTNLKLEARPKPEDPIIPIVSARKCLQNACRKLGYPLFTHHDFRHFFATTCIESGVDIPTVSRWLGHKDGGALCMRIYGHLRQDHSHSMIKKVSFAPESQAESHQESAQAASNQAHLELGKVGLKRLIARAKAKYQFPWWASESATEVFWGQINEEIKIVPFEKLHACAKQAMGREVLKHELDNPKDLIDEFLERIPRETLIQLQKKVPIQLNVE